MDDIAIWLPKFWAYFNDLGPLANFIQIAGALLTAGVVVYRLMRRRLQRQEVIQENLEQALQLSREEVAKLKGDLAEARQCNPAQWLESARVERSAGNQAKAHLVLRNGVLSVEGALNGVYFDLASYHISLYPDHGEAHIEEAHRCALLALTLAPQDRRAAMLLEEVGATRAMLGIKRGNLLTPTPEVLYPELGDVGAGSSEAAADLANRLLTAAMHHEKAGTYLISERLCARAVLVSRRGLGDVAQVTLLCRKTWARSLLLVGLISEALNEIEAVIGIEQGGQQAERDLLRSRHIRAKVLDALTRFQEALAETEELLPLATKLEGSQGALTRAIARERAEQLLNLGHLSNALQIVDELLGSDGSKTLSDARESTLLRSLRARTLRELGRAKEALDDIDLVLQYRSKNDGDNHPDTLTVRSVRASFLVSLGRADEAVHELEAVLRLEEQSLGPAHPSALVTRYELAKAFSALGRYQEALDAINALSELRSRISGPDHADSLATRLVRPQILLGKRDYEAALDELERLLPAYVRILGRNSPGALLAEYLMVRSRKGVGRVREALAKVEELIPASEAVYGARQENVLVDRALRADLLLELGEVDQACVELQSLLSPQEDVLGDDHPSTLRTRALLKSHCRESTTKG